MPEAIKFTLFPESNSLKEARKSKSHTRNVLYMIFIYPIMVHSSNNIQTRSLFKVHTRRGGGEIHIMEDPVSPSNTNQVDALKDAMEGTYHFK